MHAHRDDPFEIQEKNRSLWAPERLFRPFRVTLAEPGSGYNHLQSQRRLATQPQAMLSLIYERHQQLRVKVRLDLVLSDCN